MIRLSEFALNDPNLRTDADPPSEDTVALMPPIHITKREERLGPWIPDQGTSVAIVDAVSGQPLPFPIHSGLPMLLLLVILPETIPLLVWLNWRRLGYPGRATAALVLGYVMLPLVVGTFLLSDNALALLPPTGLIPLLIWPRQKYMEWRASRTVEPDFWRPGCIVYLLASGLLYGLGVVAIVYSCFALNICIWSPP